MKYEVICPVCKYEFLAEPSIAQTIGIHDMGCGSCPGCGTFLNLTLDTENNRMTAKIYDEWIKERNGGAGNET